MNTNNITIKVLVILAMIIALLLPIQLVKSLIEERKETQAAVEAEISEKWGGGRQELIAPIMVLPYIESYWQTDKTAENNRRKVEQIKHLFLNSDQLIVDGYIQAEERARTMFKTLVYQSKMNFRGTFSFSEERMKEIGNKQVVWKDAYLIMSMTSMRALKNKVNVQINNEQRTARLRNVDNGFIPTGLVVADIFKFDQPQNVDFNFDIVMNGTQNMQLRSYSKETKVEFKSNWKTVSYLGTVLPTQHDNKDGFNALWEIYSDKGELIDANDILNSEIVEVDLRYPVNDYQMNMRAVKYAIMFIALTFVAFFLVELLSRRRIHPMQYALVSAALILFYTLLLSLSEHIGFNWSYLVSAIAVIILVSVYAVSIFKTRKSDILLGLFLTALYIYLYVILQLEDMALLFGSIGLFIALAIVMYLSRKVDWYNLNKDEGNDKIEDSSDNILKESLLDSNKEIEF